MAFVLAKIVFTPLLLAACTFVAHRWGDAVGGWLLGLPITSGPVSVFLFAEHGAGFAESAARATLLGVVAAAVFCACYSIAAEKMRWWQSLGIAYAVCLGSAWTLSLVHLSLAASLVMVLLALAFLAVTVRATGAARAASRTESATHEKASGLPVRMLVAAASVLVITALAGLLGPRVGGILAPLPVLAAVMAASSHRRGARSQAQGLLHGALVGSWGGVAFFAVVAITLPTEGPLAAYGFATLAALVVGAIAMVVRRRSWAVMPSWLGAATN